MSISKLEHAVDLLPAKARGLREVETLRNAAGKKIRPEERAFLLDHYQKEATRYSPKARRLLAELAGTHAQPAKASHAPHFSLESRHFTKIAEQSALTFVAALKGFLAVDDETGALHFIPRKTVGKGGQVPSVAIEIPGVKLDDLEGVTFDSDLSRVLVVTEGGRNVFAIPVTLEGGEVVPGTAKKLGKLEKLGTDENRGYEGLAYLPAALSPDGRAHLLAVHEGSPKRLGLFDPKTLEPRGFLALPAPLKTALKDLSDVEVDPKTGLIALLSDQSNRIGFVSLSHEKSKSSKLYQVKGGGKHGGYSIQPLGTLDLPELDKQRAKKGATRLQPEGVAFDASGDLWVSAEGDRSLMHFLRGA